MERLPRYPLPPKATPKGSAGVRTNPAESQTTNTKFVVAAIDLGTTYSGYAYSFYPDYKDDHLKIHTYQAWSTYGEGFVTTKTPTIVLFDKEDKFHSFGYEAEKKYIDLATQNNHNGWKYFRRFKMKLNEGRNLERPMTLIDDQDKPKPAKEVFAAAIKYLKEHLLKRLQQRSHNIISTDIFWVLTVPAIWHDGARQFMMESAHLAGIPGDQLTLALEPECAAIYCKEQTLTRTFTERAELASFIPGCQLMIIDLGGGTVAITTHEVDNEGNLREIMAPTGGLWGGTQVDMAFDIFLAEMFTKTVIQIFGRECKDDQLDLQRTFELRKRFFNKDDETVVMRLPSGLFDVYRDNCNVDFQTSINRGNLAETVMVKRNKLIIKSQQITDLFKEPKDELLTHLRSLLRKSNMINVSTLVLVGGFAESHMMSDAIRDAFPGKRVITPSDAGLAVVKGAVMYGHNMDSISSRKMPSTIDYQTLLLKCKPKMLVGLAPNHVLENPSMEEIIGNVVDLKDIKEQPTSTEKNRKIYAYIHQGGLKIYQEFKRVLLNTKHLKLLADFDQHEMGVTDDQADLWPQVTQRALKKCERCIKSDLNHQGILDAFTEQEFLDDTQIRDIREQTTTTLKNELIYTEVEKQGIQGYATFKQALLEKQEMGVYETLLVEERNAMNELVSTRDILEDYMCYRINSEGIRCENSYRHKSNSQMTLTKKLRELTTEFERRYVDQVQQPMDPGWNLNEANYLTVLNEMFRDGTNWGRIVGVVSFCGALSVSCVKKGMPQDTVLEWTLRFIEQNLERWIRDIGGWVSLLDNLSDGADGSETEDQADGQFWPLEVRPTPASHLTIPSGSGDTPPQGGDQIKAYAALLVGVAAGFALGFGITKR